MANYKRLVSYMYNYQNGIKRNNVGYSRVEARNGQCKITINIKATPISDEELQVYFFKRNGYSMEGILLGKLLIRKGAGQFRTITDSENIMNSGYSLEDMGGLVLYHSDKKYYATEWDDIPVTAEMVNGSLARSPSLEKAKEEGDLKKELKAKAPIKTEEAQEAQEEAQEDQEEAIEEVQGEGQEEAPMETIIEAKEESKKTLEIGNLETNKVKRPRNWSRFEEHPEAIKIYNNFPKMYPFEDNEVAWCVRIEPQDIGVLPMEYWYTPVTF